MLKIRLEENEDICSVWELATLWYVMLHSSQIVFSVFLVSIRHHSSIASLIVLLPTRAASVKCTLTSIFLEFFLFKFRLQEDTVGLIPYV